MRLVILVVWISRKVGEFFSKSWQIPERAANMLEASGNPRSGERSHDGTEIAGAKGGVMFSCRRAQ
ncbi:hypothetical protein GCM10023156_39070 [Novipirellula rosea]|uniref:Uncharacterized protein n=1 Tax=Novipirellula rosea TaxID=1031540 RepID=A0ABP8N3Y2_9BACT